jgi:hypothetical protein
MATLQDVRRPPTGAARLRQVEPGLLAVSLLLLLNSRVGDGGRSGWLSSLLLTGCTLLFVVILINEIKTELA